MENHDPMVLNCVYLCGNQTSHFAIIAQLLPVSPLGARMLTHQNPERKFVNRIPHAISLPSHSRSLEPSHHK